jgi:hypothetical protein
MFEANYQLGIKVTANTNMIHRNGEQWLLDTHPERRGLVRDVIARFGSMLVRLGSSMERLALVDEKMRADV